jgi:hypothetical protein
MNTLLPSLFLNILEATSTSKPEVPCVQRFGDAIAMLSHLEQLTCEVKLVTIQPPHLTARMSPA